MKNMILLLFPILLIPIIVMAWGFDFDFLLTKLPLSVLQSECSITGMKMVESVVSNNPSNITVRCPIDAEYCCWSYNCTDDSYYLQMSPEQEWFKYCGYKYTSGLYVANLSSIEHTPTLASECNATGTVIDSISSVNQGVMMKCPMNAVSCCWSYLCGDNQYYLKMNPSQTFYRFCGYSQTSKLYSQEPIVPTTTTTKITTTTTRMTTTTVQKPITIIVNYTYPTNVTPYVLETFCGDGICDSGEVCVKDCGTPMEKLLLLIQNIISIFILRR